MYKNIVACTLVLFSTQLRGAEKPQARIAIAANLLPAVPDIRQEFEKTCSGCKVEFVPGSSGKLAVQIENGAPFDIFVSADMNFPEMLRKSRKTAKGPRMYAKGKLVLFTVKKIDLSEGLSLLTDTSVKRISIVNPETAPYGAAAVEALKNAGIYDRVAGKLIFAGNISQAAQYALKATDTGFLAQSIVYEKAMKRYNREGIYWIAVPKKMYRPLEQGIVLLRRGSFNPAAEKFYNFMLSEKTRIILRRYGYEVD